MNSEVTPSATFSLIFAETEQRRGRRAGFVSSEREQDSWKHRPLMGHVTVLESCDLIQVINRVFVPSVNLRRREREKK